MAAEPDTEAQSDGEDHCCHCAEIDLHNELEKERLEDAAALRQCAVHAAISISCDSGNGAGASAVAFLSAMFDTERRKIEIGRLPKL